MGDILAVWDEYRQIQWAAVIQEMQGQRADEQGILHPAWAFGKKLLLLAEEASYTNSDFRTGTGTAGSGLGC